MCQHQLQQQKTQSTQKPGENCNTGVISLAITFNVLSCDKDALSKDSMDAG